MLNRESKQINVSQLPRTMDSGRIHDMRIQQTDSSSGQNSWIFCWQASARRSITA